MLSQALARFLRAWRHRGGSGAVQERMIHKVPNLVSSAWAWQQGALGSPSSADTPRADSGISVRKNDLLKQRRRAIWNSPWTIAR